VQRKENIKTVDELLKFQYGRRPGFTRS